MQIVIYYDIIIFGSLVKKLLGTRRGKLRITEYNKSAYHKLLVKRAKRKISLKTRTLDNRTQKVNDAMGNPIIIGSLLGLIVSLTRVELPEIVLEPFTLIGAAALPVMLISFGMSLSGSRVLEPGSGRRDVLLATTIKLAVMPVAAWVIGHFGFGMAGHELFAVVVLASLPSAQNVFNYAQRYSRGVVLARDTVLLTTVGSVGVLLIASVLLT